MSRSSWKRPKSKLQGPDPRFRAGYNQAGNIKDGEALPD